MEEQLSDDQVQQMMMQEFLARRRAGGSRVPNPRGNTPPGDQYIGMAYPGGQQSLLWSKPESILKPECVNPRSKYIWAKRNKVGTSTKVRTGEYRPVLWDEVDEKNPNAEVTFATTSKGRIVCLDEFAMFELTPEAKHKYYTGWQSWARRNLVMKKQTFVESIPEMTQGHMRGEFTESDKRPEPRSR